MLDGLVEEIRRWGLWHATFIRVMSALKPVLTVSKVRSRQIPWTEPADPLFGTYKYRAATRDELLRAARELPEELNPEDIDEALNRGDICVAAFEDDRIVAFVWRCYTDGPLEDLTVTVPPGFRYGYKSFTRPEYRGRHILGALTSRTEQYCLERGATHTLSLVDVHNLASVRSGNRKKPTWLGYVWFFRLGSRALVLRSRGVRECGIKFRSSSPPAT